MNSFFFFSIKGEVGERDCFFFVGRSAHMAHARLLLFVPLLRLIMPEPKMPLSGLPNPQMQLLVPTWKQTVGRLDLEQGDGERWRERDRAGEEIWGEKGARDL